MATLDSHEVKRLLMVVAGAIVLGWGIAALMGNFDFLLKGHFKPEILTGFDVPLLTRTRHSLIHWTGLLALITGATLILGGLTSKRRRRGRGDD